jgi:hypothetical protein
MWHRENVVAQLGRLKVRLIRSLEVSRFSFVQATIGKPGLELLSLKLPMVSQPISDLTPSSNWAPISFPFANDDQNVRNTRKGSRKESPASATQNIPGIFSITIFLL